MRTLPFQRFILRGKVTGEMDFLIVSHDVLDAACQKLRHVRLNLLKYYAEHCWRFPDTVLVLAV